MSDCMSNICGMDGNYCSSCAKDRRIEELQATIKRVVDTYYDNIEPCDAVFDDLMGELASLEQKDG